MLNFTIFIFPPHFPSFNNFKMIKMPQNFLIKLNLWWDYSLVHAQRKKFAAIRGEKRLFVSHHHPLPQITGLFFLLDLVVSTSLLKLREPGTGQWDYERKTAQLWIQNSPRASSDPFGGNCKSCTPKEMLVWGALSMRLTLLVIILMLLL